MRAEAGARSERPAWRRSLVFWVRRYLPAEIAGTLTMVVAGVAVSGLAVPALVIGIVATQAESLGFYAVAGVAVWREQRRVAPDRSRTRTLVKTIVLMVFEFGPAELLDSLLVRPLLVTLAVWVIPDIAAALVLGKLLSDVVFYVLAATAFRATETAGVRGRENDAQPSTHRKAPPAASLPGGAS